MFWQNMETSIRKGNLMAQATHKRNKDSKKVVVENIEGVFVIRNTRGGFLKSYSFEERVKFYKRYTSIDKNGRERRRGY